MTLEEIKKCSDSFLSVEDVAHDVLHVAPQGLREQAQKNKSALSFPVCVVGSRILIPRKKFLESL